MNTLIIVVLTASLTMSVVILLLLLLNKVLLNKIPAAFRYYMWLIVLLGLLIPFRPNITVPFTPVQIPISLETVDISSEHIQNEQPPLLPSESAIESDAGPIVRTEKRQSVSFIHVLLGIWISGMLAIGGFHLRVYGKFTASARRWGVNVTDEQTLSVFQKVWNDMELTGNQIAIKKCAFLSSPMLIGYRKPQILLPETTISADELEHIFRHELTHYRRKDLWINLLVLLVSAIHWFNPFVYLLTKAIRADCEIACDEAVVAGKDTENRKHYGETIIGFIGTENTRTPVLSTYFFGGKKNMKNRLFSIMDTSKKRKGLAAVCVIAVVFMIFLSGSMISASFAARNTPQYIGDARAKSIALTHAGLSETQVTFIKAHLDRDDGRIVYDVEFYSGNTEYDYEIDAISGAILEYDRDIEYYSIPKKPTTQAIRTSRQTTQRPQPTPSPAPQYIGDDRAKAIALTHAELSEDQVTFLKVHLDRDDGRIVYDVEFYSGNTEYDYEIDAISGDIREFDRDIENYSIPQAPAQDNNAPQPAPAAPQPAPAAPQPAPAAPQPAPAAPQPAPAAPQPAPAAPQPAPAAPQPAPAAPQPAPAAPQYIGESQARGIALSAAGLSEAQVSRMKVKLDREDGRMVYEVEFNNGHVEYEYDIDATTGSILKADVDYD